MKRASIVSIGNELLSGQTVDTNCAYLSRKLLSLGIAVVSSYTVADEIDAVVRALRRATDDGQIVLVTGGLGPTDDDLTRQALADFLNSRLQLQEGLLEDIRCFFTRRNLQMSDKNRNQAFIPVGTKALANSRGTAPGIRAELADKLIFVMPGVPSEMEAMFEESVMPELSTFAAAQAVVVRKLKCFGTGESNIAELLGDVMARGRDPLINCTVKGGIITLHIIATAQDETQAERLAQIDQQMLTGLLGDLIYAVGEQTLGETVGRKLASREMTLAVAESCTGGIIGRMLTDIPGSSRYFTYGWITYSNRAKITELGVPSELIDAHGAVSEAVSTAMAQGARTKAGTDFSIAITGIAGPDGGCEQKPVGLVYISIDSDFGCKTERFEFSGGRVFIRLRAAQTALNMLRILLDSR